MLQYGFYHYTMLKISYNNFVVLESFNPCSYKLTNLSSRIKTEKWLNLLLLLLQPIDQTLCNKIDNDELILVSMHNDVSIPIQA